MTDLEFVPIDLKQVQTVLSPLAKHLLNAKDDPNNWAFVPITDWKSPEARAIRDEVRDATVGEFVVVFRGYTNGGVKGTLMHLKPWAEWEAERSGAVPPSITQSVEDR